jgi:EAL domain-containing protein (putative c-di-GMP-specific phosphodiesterase class I)
LLARGARLAADDLGAASGDLTRLLTIRPQVVKIDRGVVSGCANDPTRLRLVQVVIDVADAGGAVVCAEGIEDVDDREALKAAGVDLVQGFLLGRPGPLWSRGSHVPIASQAG